MTTYALGCDGWNYEDDKDINEPSQQDQAIFRLLGIEYSGDSVKTKINAYQEDDDEVKFESAYYPGEGGIEAIANYKTSDNGGEAPTPWGEVEDSSLNWIRRYEISNGDTTRVIGVMQRALQNAGKTDTAMGPGYTVWTLTKDNTDFFAIFGTPNGNGVYYLLRDHIKELTSEKSVMKIFVIQPGQTGHFQSNPDIVFLFGDREEIGI
ncbi:hypothetical protein N7492_007482 [Penicillium capsulatum]|uniref:Uncharacterized protein n=1 Tax=Penicillium capsulatum TaxID=69766 RepID=A0A9W9I430_9EURO|nr:hypothetical protein N7492_007482 [Penicillium capsulatum]KAJ6117315.1 hypothetical protein N7512_007040 [Penicillium capsulatum]